MNRWIPWMLSLWENGHFIKVAQKPIDKSNKYSYIGLINRKEIKFKNYLNDERYQRRI